jgi:spore coat polysaccharide biosynthesis protein SpsF (cytidylyltransferase family)
MQCGGYWQRVPHATEHLALKAVSLFTLLSASYVKTTMSRSCIGKKVASKILATSSKKREKKLRGLLLGNIEIE